MMSHIVELTLHEPFIEQTLAVESFQSPGNSLQAVATTCSRSEQQLLQH